MRITLRHSCVSSKLYIFHMLNLYLTCIFKFSTDLLFKRYIKHFLEQTNEIVFLNIHRFNPKEERNADDSAGHRRLKRQLRAALEKYMVPRSETRAWKKTFHECWNEDKRLFVSYNHKSYVKDPLLWHGMTVRYNKINNFLSLIFH